ncbi:hypothetical protein BDV10DRAFT_177714 [Aspergillus recurvatus]
MAFQELLRAATTISNTEIREEDMSYLLTHRIEFETAVAKLRALLGSSSVNRSVSVASAADEIPVSPGLPSPTAEQRPSVSETLPHDISERSQPISTGHDTAVDTEAVPDSVQKVLSLLNKRKKTISEFTYRPETHLNICPEYDNEDLRITVIRFVRQKRTEAHYYLAGHAALSLAHDFLHWQGEVGIRTRLDVLSANINDGGGGCYREYANTCSRFRDKERAAEYIEFGIKLLFFELLCSVRYKGPITCPDSSSHSASASSSDSDALSHTRALSVREDPPSPNPTSAAVDTAASSHLEHAVVYPLFFVWRAFYRCRYRDLPALANAVLSSQFWGEWAETKKDWHGLNCPLFAGTTPPIVPAKENGKRIPTDQLSRERLKRRRTEQSNPRKHPSLPLLNHSSVRDIPPDRPQVFPDQVQYATTRDIWPLGSPVFRDLQQDTPARDIWPLGSPVFPDQPQYIAARNICPVGPTIFPENLQSISTSEPPTPCGLHLSTPEIASEVDIMLRNLRTTISNPTGTQT